LHGGVNGSGSSPGKRNGQYRQRTKPAIAEVPARASLKGKPPDASIQNNSGLPRGNICSFCAFWLLTDAVEKLGG
jgi:hypothetical protein